MKPETPRFWVWAFVIVQLVGLGIDAVWHGLLHPGFEPETLGEMVRHLAAVHLPLYVGVGGAARLYGLGRPRRREAIRDQPRASSGVGGGCRADGWRGVARLFASRHAAKPYSR